MKEGWVVFKNKYLLTVLAVLCCIMAILVGIIIFNTTRQAEETAIEDDENNEASMTIVDEETLKTINELEDARAQAKEILARDSITADDIINFYAPYIDKYTKLEEPERISSYVWARSDDLLAKGFKKEMLDTLLEMDLSAVGDADKYRQYANIVVLARGLGLETTANEYYSLMEAAGWGDEAINVAAERIKAIEQEGRGSSI